MQAAGPDELLLTAALASRREGAGAIDQAILMGWADKSACRAIGSARFARSIP